jgi:hypothetical protein
MIPSIRPVLLLAVCAAGCGESPNGGGGADLAACCPDLGAASGHDLAGGGDLASADDPDGGICSPGGTSPSGYACDPWSVHLYVSRFVSASPTTLRLQLWHDPTYEGAASDQTWPIEHDYWQLLTVDIPIDNALESFLCVVFAKTTPPDSYPIDDTLATNLDDGSFSLVITPQGTKRWQNVRDLCGSGSLPALLKPELLSGPFADRPALPEVAVMIPMLPNPHDLTVGAQVSGWLARGIMGADEDRELVPTIRGTVVEVQTRACNNRQIGDC